MALLLFYFSLLWPLEVVGGPVTVLLLWPLEVVGGPVTVGQLWPLEVGAD